MERAANVAFEAAQRAAAASDEERRSEQLTAERDRSALLLELNTLRRQLAGSQEALAAARASGGASATPVPGRSEARTHRQLMAPGDAAAAAPSGALGDRDEGTPLGRLGRSRQSPRVVAVVTAAT